jgi:cell division septal protein FtsQ
VPIAAPTDRRFLRAQVKPGRRHSPWRRWAALVRVVAAAAVIGGVAGAAAVAVVGAPALRVARITVKGTRHLSGDEVLSLLDGLRGRHVLFVDLEQWRLRVLASRWVADATLRRSLPGTVEVRVVERRPLAISRIEGQLFLIDEQGVVIDEYGPRYAEFDLPILDGLAPAARPESAVNGSRVRLASRLLHEVRGDPGLAGRISQLDVSDPRNAVVTVDQDTARVRLGEAQFTARLQAYLEMAPTLREQMRNIDYVDLRYGEWWFVGKHGSSVPVDSGAAAAVRRSGATNQ